MSGACEWVEGEMFQLKYCFVSYGAMNILSSMGIFISWNFLEFLGIFISYFVLFSLETFLLFI